MMRLLLIFSLLFSCCLGSGFAEERGVLISEVSGENVKAEIQVSSKLSGGFYERNWIRDYCLMMKALTPVKQLDLPGDNSKSWNFLVGKTLHSAQKAEISHKLHPLLFSKYIRFLSGRYVNGFYIYSLGELII